MIRYQFTSDWYHFYFHQTYTDFTADNKIKKNINIKFWQQQIISSELAGAIFKF